MSISSEYEISLKINDNSNDAIRALEKGLKNVGDIAKKAVNGADIAKSLKETKDAADKMIKKIGELSKDTTLDIDAVVKAYAKNAQKAVGALEAQYASLKDEQTKIADEHARLTKELQQQRAVYADIVKHGGDGITTTQIIRQTEEKIKQLGYERLESQIKQNREIRANLVASAQQAKVDVAMAKKKEAIAKEVAKLNAMQAKRDAAIHNKEKKALDEEIKKQQALIRSMQQAEKVQQACVKQQEAMAKAIEKSAKGESKLIKAFRMAAHATQYAYNVTGMVGGFGRSLKAGGQAIAGITRDAMTAADDEVKKEKEARRIKGYASEEAMGILNELYFQTGGDYAEIVDAINRVQTTLKATNRDELIQATRLELRNPGMTLAFASSNTESSVQNYRAYAHRMELIRRATGASEEQIQASTQKMANYKTGAFNNSSITELQAVYLGLQNSGAFESQDELDKAFDGFVNRRKNSKENAWKDAQTYDWVSHVHNERNRIQAANTLQNMDWEQVRLATDSLEAPPVKQTALESTSEQMRRIEYQKNQILVKLLPAIAPLFDGLAKLLNSDAGKKAIQGLLRFIEVVVPKLADIFISLAQKLGVLIDVGESIARQNEEQTQRQVEAAASKSTAGMIAYRSAFDKTMRFANGGIASFPSICGERGPEAIIPLDYSRAQRAENIAYSIQNNFNMSGNQTTALSLAEAVSSRDFARAMGRAAFKANRLGAF